MFDRYRLPPQCIAVSGASGLVGKDLCRLLTGAGHQVVRLVRDIHEATPGQGPIVDARSRKQGDTPGVQSESTASPRSATDTAPRAGNEQGDTLKVAPWHSEAQQKRLQGVDTVIHLAGQPIAEHRWTAAEKRAICESRVVPTRQLCQALAALDQPPSTLLCASAIGIYGDRGEESLSESSAPGDGFLADVARQWEDACQAAVQAGIRVVNLRFGIILSADGGALQKMVLPANLGFGGRLGSGRQWWSWIGIDDALGAIYHALATESLRGAVNVVAPHAVTQAEFAKTLGGVLHRPAVLPAPAFALRLALGEMADALLLASARVEPKQLLSSDYNFHFTHLRPCLEHILGRNN